LSQEALVLVSYGGQGVVELPDGSQVKCRYRRSVGRPYCGDRVIVEDADDHAAVVCRILPQRNVFVRADARQQRQVIAVNLDQVLVVIAPRPEPSRDLVERYLVAAHGLGIKPLIVLNKAELMPEAGFREDGPLTRLESYRQLGCEVIETSCKTEPGTAALHESLRDRISILAGQSGVGKSSLVNQLIPDLELQTGALSRVTGKGTHTTTTTIMYQLPGGGRLLDSPGVWEYGLWKMNPQELALGFREFDTFLGHCKFNNCLHQGEPACAVRAAVDTGEVLPWRYQAYLRLLEQSG
jgi:ribosome biogenesis GTPase